MPVRLVQRHVRTKGREEDGEQRRLSEQGCRDATVPSRHRGDEAIVSEPVEGRAWIRKRRRASTGDDKVRWQRCAPGPEPAGDLVRQHGTQTVAHEHHRPRPEPSDRVAKRTEDGLQTGLRMLSEPPTPTRKAGDVKLDARIQTATPAGKRRNACARIWKAHQRGPGVGTRNRAGQPGRCHPPPKEAAPVHRKASWPLNQLSSRPRHSTADTCSCAEDGERSRVRSIGRIAAWSPPGAATKTIQV